MPSPVTGQAQGAGLSTPAPLSATPVNCIAFSIKAPRSNTGAAYIGGSNVTNTTGFQMDPGDEMQYERLSQNGQPSYQLNPSDFYVVANAGDRITWLASPLSA